MRGFVRVVSVVAVSVALFALGGCVGGPAKSANEFVRAATNGNKVEAGSYVLDSGADVMTLLPSDASPDFKVVEEGPDAAKVVSQSDERDYMIMDKIDGTWKVSEVCFVSDADVTEAVSYDTTYQDDPSQWEGQETVVSEGRPGETVFTVSTRLLNGEASEVDRVEKQVKSSPVAAVAKRGTKPRSKGWMAISDRVCRGPLRFRVTDITQESDGLWVTIEFINAIDASARVLDAKHRIVVGEFKRGTGQWREGYGEDRDSVTGPWLDERGFESNEDEQPENSREPLRIRRLVSPSDGSTPKREDLLFLFGPWNPGRSATGQCVLTPDGTSQVFTVDQVYPGPVR